MPEFSLERARVALCDAAYMNRQATLGGLQSLGFANVKPFARVDQLSDASEFECFDLIIMELKGQEAGVSQFVRHLRARRLGGNPFATIILTTWDLSQDCVRQVITTGADDLLGRPFSIKQLQQRVLGAINQRKKFVVTCDYLGPSRRKMQRHEDTEALFDVPNTLRERVVGNGADFDIVTQIEQAWREVQRWRMYRYGEKLSVLLDIFLNEQQGVQGGGLQKSLRALGGCASRMEEEAVRTGVAGADQIVAYAVVLKRMVARLDSRLEPGMTAEIIGLVRDVVARIAECTAELKPAGTPRPNQGLQPPIALVN